MAIQMLRSAKHLFDFRALRLALVCGGVLAAGMLAVTLTAIAPSLAWNSAHTPRVEVSAPAVPPMDGPRQSSRPDEALRRPLFAATRRPPPPPIPPPSIDPLARFQLVGTIGSGANAAATLLDRQTGRALIVRRGQSIGDWVLAEVSPRSIKLRHGSLENILSNEPFSSNTSH